jgi:hypothetical protein
MGVAVDTSVKVPAWKTVDGLDSVEPLRVGCGVRDSWRDAPDTGAASLITTV